MWKWNPKWFLGVAMGLIAAAFIGCSQPADSSESGKQPPSAPDGPLGPFAASCSSTMDCCAQCFNYYGAPLTAAEKAQFEAGSCGDYTKPCSLKNAIGTCDYEPSDANANNVTVGDRGVEDVRYATNGAGMVYSTAAASKDYCDTINNGTWTPLP